MDENSVAVIGMACRFPMANNVDEFWKVLVEGIDGITTVPNTRLAESQEAFKFKTNTKGGFLKCPVDEFDAKFFGMSKTEVEFVDPQQRLLLEVSWEALEDASINPHELRSTRTGIFTGTMSHDYSDLMIRNGIQPKIREYLGNAFGATAGRK